MRLTTFLLALAVGAASAEGADPREPPVASGRPEAHAATAQGQEGPGDPSPASEPASPALAVGSAEAPWSPPRSEPARCWIDVSPWGWGCGGDCPLFTPAGSSRPSRPGISGELEIAGDGALLIPVEAEDPWLLRCDDGAARSLLPGSRWAVQGGALLPLVATAFTDEREDRGPRRVILAPPLAIIHEDTAVGVAQEEASTFVIVRSGAARVEAPAPLDLSLSLRAGQAVEISLVDGRWHVASLAGRPAQQRWAWLEAIHEGRRGSREPSPTTRQLEALARWAQDADGPQELEEIVEGALALGEALAPRGLYLAWLSATSAGEQPSADRLAFELHRRYPASAFRAFVPPGPAGTMLPSPQP